MTNIKKFPKKGETLPQNCSNTESYIMQDVLFANGPSKTVTDFTTGEQRNRRWGMVVSMSIAPQFDQTPTTGPILLPSVPARFFTADSIEELRARVLYEIDKALAMAKMSVEQPDEFIKAHTEMLAASMTEPEAAEDDMS